MEKSADTQETVNMPQSEQLAELHRKVDRLTTMMEAQAQRHQGLDELKRDLVPIANHAIKLTIDELAEIGTEFQVEDLMFLVKRLLRSTDLLLRMLDQMEALSSLGEEGQLLGRQVFSQAVDLLDSLERRGFFSFVEGGWYMFEKILDEFDAEDVRALGDNIVLILTTIRNLTQPEIMSLTNRAVEAIRPSLDAGDEDVSLWQLIRELRDPRVRTGAARMIQLVKSLADPIEPSIAENGK